MVEDVGSRAGENDCQLVSAWGGDVTAPQEDTSDEQIGDYLHDPVEFRMTTGESGPDGVSGEPYDASTGLFWTVDNQFELGLLSEGENAGDHEGGPACGEVFGEDIAAIFNEALELPTTEGELYGEFDWLIP